MKQLFITSAISIFFLTAAPASSQPLQTVPVEDISNREMPTSSRLGIRISGRVGDAAFRALPYLEIHRDQTVTLRIQTDKKTTAHWYLIFADLTRQYQNANPPWQGNPYRWTGFDRIQYYRIEIPELQNQTEVNPIPYLEVTRQRIVKWFQKNGNNHYGLGFYHSRTGTFWFQAEVTDQKGLRRSTGIEDVTDQGLSPKVFRLSIREDDSYIGYLRSLHNVPGVFGSVLSQSRNYIGADCADILMTAWAGWKHKKPDKNYNVQMLVTKFHQNARITVSGGTPDHALTWGKEVQPGDFIAVSYTKDAKKYHHIGALLADENNNGILDAADSVLHAGPDALHQTLLSDGAFDGRVVLLRP